MIQCQKLVIYRNHPHLFFSNKEKKQNKTKHGSVIQCLGHWQILSASFQTHAPGGAPCGPQWRPMTLHGPNRTREPAREGHVS